MADPNGIDLCSGSIAVSSLSTSAATVSITMDTPATLTSGVEYAIVIRRSDTGLNLTFAGGYDSGNYANGTALTSVTAGVVWVPIVIRDMWFQTFEGAAYRDQYTPITLDGISPFRRSIWAGQTFIATSTYDISKINLKLFREDTTPNGTVVVSIQATGPAVPSKPTNPTPDNEATDIKLSYATISWEDGGGATSYDVYFGTESGNLSLIDSGVTETSYSMPISLAYSNSYYWRIDAVNGAGTTTGDEWYFVAVIFKPPISSGLSFTGDPTDENDGLSGTPTGENNIYTVRRVIAIANNRLWYES